MRNHNARKKSKIIYWTLKLMPLFLVALFHFMKGYNHTMTLLDLLQNLNASQVVTLLLLALGLLVIVILAALLLTYVKSWIFDIKSIKTSQLFQTTFDNCLATMLQALKQPLKTEQPKEGSSTTLPSSNQEDQTQEDPTLQLVSDFILKIKEAINNEKR